MTVVVDTSIVLALYDGTDDDHAAVARWYEGLDEDLVTTPVALAEMDYLVTQRSGLPAAQGFWSDLDRGAIQVRWWSTALTETIAIARSRPVLGLADASLLALAPVVRTTRIATLDRTHFDTARTPDGEPYILLP
jgi:predicted nucleic acid-binding protein